jgi:transposase
VKSCGQPHTRRPVIQRLVTTGKPKKVAMVVCGRKLLTVLNALLTHQTPWRAPTNPALLAA